MNRPTNIKKLTVWESRKVQAWAIGIAEAIAVVVIIAAMSIPF